MMFTMNRLTTQKRAQILGLLVEGMSLRAASRLADVSINTVTKLLVDVGTACAGDPPVHKFVKGDLRLYFCFFGDVAIVCSECGIKKTQKTEKHYCSAARALLQRYKDAHDQKKLKESNDYERIRALR